MADSKITDLAALTGANLATGDVLEVTDISDTSMDPSGTSKKISGSELSMGLFLLRDGAAVSRHLPTGGVAATFDRGNTGSTSQGAFVTSGTLYLVGIDLIAGQVITSVSFRSGATPLASGTHQFFGIADSSRAVQRWTGDDTSTAWAANSSKTLNLTSTYTVPSTGWYYLALLIAAGTVPTLMSMPAVGANIANVAPTLAGSTSDTGLTTPPTLPFTAGTITSGTVVPYGWLS